MIDATELYSLSQTHTQVHVPFRGSMMTRVLGL